MNESWAEKRRYLEVSRYEYHNDDYTLLMPAGSVAITATLPPDRVGASRAVA